MRRRRRVAAALRAGYRVAYRLVVVWSVVFRPRRRGVKCVVCDRDGRALFVRHSYGNRDAWELPGGGAHLREAPVAAARREAREELGVDLASWRPLGRIDGVWMGSRLRLDCFAADWPDGARLEPDPVELSAVAWFPLADPPAPLGAVTRAALSVLER